MIFIYPLIAFIVVVAGYYGFLGIGKMYYVFNDWGVANGVYGCSVYLNTSNCGWSFPLATIIGLVLFTICFVFIVRAVD